MSETWVEVRAGEPLDVGMLVCIVLRDTGEWVLYPFVHGSDNPHVALGQVVASFQAGERGLWNPETGNIKAVTDAHRHC